MEEASEETTALPEPGFPRRVLREDVLTPEALEAVVSSMVKIATRPNDAQVSINAARLLFEHGFDYVHEPSNPGEGNPTNEEE